MKPGSPFRIRPELRSALLRKLWPLLGTLVVFALLFVADMAMRAEALTWQVGVLSLVIVLLIVRRIIEHCKAIVRANHQIDSGKTEHVEVTFEHAARGYIAKVRSALDFSVQENDNSEVYFVERTCNGLVKKQPLGQPVILPAIYGFDPADPLLLRTKDGILWLQASDIECVDEAANILLQAYSLYGKNQDRPAIAALDRALQVNPKYIDALELRGYCKQRVNDVEGAIADFSAVLHERSRSVAGVTELSASYLARASAYMEVSDYAAAVTDLDAAITLCPERADLYYVRATAHEQLEQGSLAVRDHTMYLELSPEISDEERAGVLIYRAMGQANDEAALRDLDESISVMPTATAYYFRACIFAHEERYNDIIEQCSKALEVDSSFVEALELRVEAYMNSGNPAAAERDIVSINRVRAEAEQEDDPDSRGLPPLDFTPPNGSTLDGTEPSVAQAPRHNRIADSVTAFFKRGSLLSGERWRFAFLSYGFVSVLSPVVLFMTVRYGLAGFGSGLALCAVSLLVVSLFLHCLARVAGGKAALRDTAVIVAWSGLIAWVLGWVPVMSACAPVSAVACTVYGITSRHGLSTWRSLTVVLLPSICLVAGVAVYLGSISASSECTPVLHARNAR